jgi:phage protein D/phage baseplate assembly protein gpV
MPTRTVVDTPSILLNGNEQRVPSLTQLVVTQTIGAAAHANLRFAPRGRDVEGTLFTIGSEVLVKAPDRGTTGDLMGTDKVQVFAGVIVSVGLDWRANRAELIVDAYDKSHKLAQATVIESYVDSTASEIVQKLASAAGLSVQIASSFGRAKLPFVQQHGTAHRFITELVQNEGHEWWMEGTKLIVKRRADAGAAAATLGGDGYILRRFQARFSELDRTTAVRVRGWDSKTKSTVTGRAKGVNAGAPSNPKITESGFRPRGEATSWPRRVVSIEDVDSVVNGIAARMGAALVSARGECDVAAAVRPGAVVEVQNVNPEWNGNYYITESEHVFGDNQPFVTRFVAGASDDESIAGLLGAHGGGHGARLADGLTIGVVTNNSDPDSLSRVKVRFPYLTDQGESAWARLVTPGAGVSRGLQVMPEIDDEVLIGFENGDIRRPFVLGGLWNGKDKPPITKADLLDGSSVKTRSFTTRKGHFLSFVDGGNNADDSITLALKNSRATLVISGEKIDLITTEDKPLTVKTSEASIVIAAGGDITLKGKNITLDAETTITLKGSDVKIDARSGLTAKAGQKVSIKGTGGVEVDGSPGMTDVKGSMVNLN